MDAEKFVTYFLKILPSLQVTLRIMGYTFLFGIIFGTVLFLAKISAKAPLRKTAFGYTSFMRGIPTLIMLFVMFYGLPAVLKALLGINIYGINKEIFVIITMSMYSSSMISEIMRGAYKAISIGQMEAALSIGETRLTAMRRIILPQAVIIMLPSLGNTIINLMKEASLAYAIGVVDVLGRITILKSNTTGKYTVEMYLSATLMFWFFSLLVQLVFGLLEKYLSRYKRGPVKA